MLHSYRIYWKDDPKRTLRYVATTYQARNLIASLWTQYHRRAGYAG